MTVLRLRCERPDIVDGRLDVRGREHRYLSRVRRARVGEPVEVLDGAGRRWRGTIGRIGPEDACLERLTELPVAVPRPVTLGLGIGRTEPLARVARAAAELGVARLVLLRCSRDLGRPAAAYGPLVERLCRVTAEALRAGGAGRAPEIVPPTDLLGWAGSPDLGARIVLDADGDPLADVVRRLGAMAVSSWTVVVGPEGGFEDAELESLAEAGFARASLGPLSLRVETAAVGVLAVLRALVG